MNYKKDFLVQGHASSFPERTKAMNSVGREYHDLWLSKNTLV
jgi:hypothetical protein